MSDANWVNRTIWTGDNLPIMRGMNSESIDLIYLDPPFNSNANYAAPIGSEAAGAEFKDTWSLQDVDVAWLDLIEAKHPKLLMDAVFGRKQFVNQIVWERIKGAGKRSQHQPRSFGRNSDTVFLYCKSNQYVIDVDAVALPYPDLHKLFPRMDDRGRFKRRSPFRPPGLGPRPNLCYEYKGITPPHESGWTVRQSRLEQLDADDEIEWVRGIPWRKQRPGNGIPLSDIWVDIPQVGGKEDTGYGTQKPVALLSRIIKASSNDNDLILDPFCGCATACVAADALNRQWVGIDVSEKAAQLVRQRIDDLMRRIVHRTDIPKRTDIGRIPLYSSLDNRKALYGEQGGDCNGCGTHFEPRHLQVDHIIARAQGGTDHISNLQLLCGSCNSIKGDRGMEYLVAKLHQ